MKNNIIVVNVIFIGVSIDKNNDYICISDIAFETNLVAIPLT